MHVLAIANSFGEDALAYLHQIADAHGFDLEAVNLMIGGCKLEHHAALLKRDEPTPDRPMGEGWIHTHYVLQINGEDSGRYISLREALDLRKWDVVTFQQASGYSGMPETFEPHLSELIEVVQQTNPQAKLFMHETWAYEWDSEHEGFLTYNRDQGEMYQRLSRAYREHADKYDLGIIPVGRLIQHLRKDAAFDPLQGGMSLCRDGFHLDLVYGRYAAALLWFRVLSGYAIDRNFCLSPVADFKDVDASLIEKINEAVQSLELT